MSDTNFRYNSKESQKTLQYRSLANYPYPEPKDIHRLNPLCLKSLKNLDVDDLQDVFGKSIQEQRSYEDGQRLQKEIIINGSDEIKELKDAIEHAKLNKILSRQMNQNLLLRKQKLIKEAEEEELVLKEIENEKRKNEEEKEKKKIEFLKNREINLKQIRDKKLLQEQAEKEYERDKKLVDDIVRKMYEEDIALKKEDQRKKEINKLFMQNAYKERDLLKQKELENDKKQDEAIKKYHESVALREKNVAQKKNDLQKQKDKIFNKLCEEEAKRKAEQDYWDTVRSELHMEQDLKKNKLKEKEEEEKRQKMKDDVINSALKQMQFKEMKKKEEEANDAKYKEKLLEKYAQDEQLEKEKQKKQREGTNNYNSNSKRKSRFREEIDEYPPFKSPENKYKPSGFNSSINKNKFNLDYNNGISDFSNNIQIEDDKDENNDMNQTEEGEHEDKNMKNNDEHSDLHDMSFEPEKGSKKKRRNRSSSVDDKKYKEDNIKCKCMIF